MYDQLRNELITKLTGAFTSEQIQLITSALDNVAVGYDITQKSRDIVIYDTGVPEVVKMYVKYCGMTFELPEDMKEQL